MLLCVIVCSIGVGSFGCVFKNFVVLNMLFRVMSIVFFCVFFCCIVYVVYDLLFMFVFLCLYVV